MNIYIRLIDHFTAKLVTQSLLGNGLLKKQHTDLQRIVLRDFSIITFDNLLFILELTPADNKNDMRSVTPRNLKNMLRALT